MLDEAKEVLNQIAETNGKEHRYSSEELRIYQLLNADKAPRNENIEREKEANDQEREETDALISPIKDKKDKLPEDTVIGGRD
jgi:hypothetical protein